MVNIETSEVASYVQTRGSIPLLWKQSPNLKYKPKPFLSATAEDQEAVFRSHLQEQQAVYQHTVMVNLIDQKPPEWVLGKEMGKQCDTIQNSNLEPLASSVSYIAFDFHKECKKMRYDRISVLVDQLEKDLQNHQ